MINGEYMKWKNGVAQSRIFKQDVQEHPGPGSSCLMASLSSLG